MVDDTSRRTTVHTDIHDVRALTDTGAIPVQRTRPEERDRPSSERSRRASGTAR
ncbi:hypothetical protein [Amnibacterium kyonggiense]